MSRRWLAMVVTVAAVLLATTGFVAANRFSDGSGPIASADAGSNDRPPSSPPDGPQSSSTPTAAPTVGEGTESGPVTTAASTTSAELTPGVVWRSDGEAVGAWVELTWPKPTLVDHVDVRTASSAPFFSAQLAFDGGDSLGLDMDSVGVAHNDFAPREVSSARLVITDAPANSTSVALSHFTADSSGPALTASPTASSGSAPTTSSSTSLSGALTDGDVAHGRTGTEWTAAEDDASPWVQLSWASSRQLASVQVFGPAAVDPAAPWNARLHGLLRFSDGTSVVVSGIAGGGGQATTIAFAPRTSSWVRLELAQTFTGAAVSLREFAAYEVGTTPPRWPHPGGGFSTTSTIAEQCSASSTAVGRSTGGQLALVCPTPGSAVSGTATIVVAGPARTPVEATAWVDSEGIAPAGEGRVATGVTDDQGRAVLSFGTATLPTGPFAVKVMRTGPTAQDSDVPLYVQLVNRSGVALDTDGHAPAGMTLQYAEEFTSPLSISRQGTDTVYAATKPSHEGGGSFGDAWFADPAAGAGNISTLDSEYLRLRVQPSDPTTTPWGLEHIGGIVSSAHVGGSGFAAQYGYFEARMLGAPGIGTWPAFWMLDTENATHRGETASEVDAVELYGHNTAGSCHTTHNWGYGTNDGGVATCLADNGFGDWALSWHTYGVRFVPGGADFFIDGEQVASSTGLRQAADPHYFLIDLALGGGWPVDLAATGDIADLYVDWVHVYS